MRKRALLVSFILVLAVAMNAYAGDTETAWHGFWNSVGGALHNAMPWNWGDSAAK